VLCVVVWSQLSRQFEECRREKETMVLRYAQAEKKNLELQERCERAERRLMERSHERDALMARWQAVKTENSHAAQCLEARVCNIHVTAICTTNCTYDIG